MDRLVEDLIDAVRNDAYACDEGGYGDYKPERAALIEAIARLEAVQPDQPSQTQDTHGQNGLESASVGAYVVTQNITLPVEQPVHQSSAFEAMRDEMFRAIDWREIL